MKIKLLNGSFTKQEVMDIITKMIDVKIKFHEEKIKQADHEEDTKMREKRIKELQKELYEARLYLEHVSGPVSVESEIIL